MVRPDKDDILFNLIFSHGEQIPEDCPAPGAWPFGVIIDPARVWGRRTIRPGHGRKGPRP